MEMEPVLIVGFLFIGLPWIIFHYVTKWKTAATITTDDEALLEELYQLAKRLDERMDTVERLVASDNSGQPVELTIVRGGRISNVAVTLGERRVPESTPWYSRLERWAQPFYNSRHHHPAYHAVQPGQQLPKVGEPSWESFDSLSLTKVNGDQYKAVIGYLTTDGNHKSLEFQGTRDEIRQQILAQNDLPDTERNQLMTALTSRDVYFPFPDWPFQAFEQDFPLPPWWSGYPQF